MIAPACNGELIAERWNRDGQLMFTVTEQGAPKYGAPAGTDDLMSVIGFQRTGSGQGYSPIALRFSFSD
ncbi:hypothetical protein RPMA_19120 [Tardiphaga alba]|uniref:Uncharacterized protein n=1 Tax=Tardiphaga alba TaxID=340268 RepID=A0ABX8AAI3_9BRAD|nr:hypothetical protein [Tardiphaga alba]QUS40707.1 hypothetical protein RPMA_19120 [Tardiphaga alba]